MKKFFLIFAIIFVLGFGLTMQAHGAGNRSLPDIFNALGVQEPTLLPDSTFYFIKDWGRGIHLFFTFDSAKKAELQARITDEKLAEFEKLISEKPNEKDSLDQALQNYLDARSRLTQRLDSLKGKNKNTDTLLEKIVNQTIEHQKLFDDLKGTADEETIKETTKAIGDTAKKALELDEKTFKNKLKEKIKNDEDDTDNLDALENLNESDDELNTSLGDIQDELETEQGTSTEELNDVDTKELNDINHELDQEQSGEIQNDK